MHRIPAVLPASPLAACADAAPSPCLNGGGAPAFADRAARRERRHARRPDPVWGRVKRLAVALLLASATGAEAQTPRNGPEWGGKDHQPTEAEVIQRERQAGVQVPKAEQSQDDRTVQQLDQQLLRKEGLNSNPAPSPAPPAQR